MALSLRSLPRSRVPVPSPGLIAALLLAGVMGYTLLAPFLHAPAMAARETQALAVLRQVARALDELPASAPADEAFASATRVILATIPAPTTQPTAVQPARPGGSAPASQPAPQAFRWSSGGYWFQAALVAAQEPIPVAAFELLAWPDDRDVTGSAIFAWHAAGDSSRGLFQSRNMVQSYEGSERGPRPGASLPQPPAAGTNIHIGRDRERWRRLEDS